MKGNGLATKAFEQFEEHLIWEKKSASTVEKYLRDIRAFADFVGGGEVTKETVIAYKDRLISRNYAVRSINSMLASINSLFSFLGREECKVKSVKLQRQVYCSEDKELSRTEYTRLVNAAKQKGNERLNLLIQAICGTGIRVSELPFITVEAVKSGEAAVSLKGKTRSVFIVKDLQKKIAPLCSEARNKVRLYFCYPYRQAHEPYQHLAGDEKPMQAGTGQSVQSISA